MYKIIIFSLLFSCISKKKNTIKKSIFQECFENIDSTQAGETVGCVMKVYKYVDDNYILEISPNKEIIEDKCYLITKDSSKIDFNVKLFVFDNKEDRIMNFCSDLVININNYQPYVLIPKSYEMVIGFSNTKKDYFQTTIWIKQMVFMNGKQTIRFKDEVLWKVTDVGTPG